MRHIAVIGSGPAGYYTAEAAQKTFGEDVRVDIIDRMPVPFGLIRTGVAPDHQSIKSVARRYEAVAMSETVRFVGNVSVGRDVSIPELVELYDAVVLATGAPADRPLAIPGDDLPGVVGSAAFVGWYNGHPDHAGLSPPLDGRGAVIVGNGNVALDVARVLTKVPDELGGSDIVAHALDRLARESAGPVTILGRRGPQQITMTPKELEELGDLSRAWPVVDAADLPPPETDAALDANLRTAMRHLRRFAANDAAAAGKTTPVTFDFFARPVRIEGDGKVEAVVVERTTIDGDGTAIGSGETYRIPASLVVSCIGYRTPALEGVPYDDRLGRFANREGRIGPGLYAVGWARRGPTGTIGSNRPDGFAIIDKIAADIGTGAGKAGRPALDALLEERGVNLVTFRDWQKIDAAEVARARTGAPREKFVDVREMIAARSA